MSKPPKAKVTREFKLPFRPWQNPADILDSVFNAENTETVLIDLLATKHPKGEN